MSNEQNKKATENKATTIVQPKKVVEPTYTVAEFVAAPSTLDVQSPDLIRAAFKQAGKEEATVTEAKKIVNDFKKKEVK